MAKKPMSTAEAERMNLVAQDQIWLTDLKGLKDFPSGSATIAKLRLRATGTFFFRRWRLKAETEARQNWAQNWGFLTTPLQELIKCEDKPPTPKPRIELPQSFRIRPVTPVEKYIKVLPSPPVPKTTQGFIGWRSGVPGLNKCLLQYEELRSCKGEYARELGWPEQGIH